MMNYDSMIDLDELVVGLDVDVDEHPLLIYDAYQNLASLLDSDTGEIVHISTLH